MDAAAFGNLSEDEMDKPFFYNPFSAGDQHDPRRIAFYREAPPVMPLFPLPGNNGTLYLALCLDAIDNVLRGEEFGVSPRDVRARQFGSFPLLDLLVAGPAGWQEQMKSERGSELKRAVTLPQQG